MSQATGTMYGFELVKKMALPNGVVYEHWVSGDIDHCHHVHLQDGTVFSFEHESHEGKVKLNDELVSEVKP
jgi:hypothetical protein